MRARNSAATDPVRLLFSLDVIRPGGMKKKRLVLVGPVDEEDSSPSTDNSLARTYTQTHDETQKISLQFQKRHLRSSLLTCHTGRILERKGQLSSTPRQAVKLRRLTSANLSQLDFLDMLAVTTQLVAE